ncbi:MAG: hypothetical protein WC449_00695 [Candidatus Paceibacterota bacterium]
MVLSDDILKKIEEGKIKPAPRWMFLLKGWVYWAVFALCVIVGSISASFIFYELAGGDLAALAFSVQYLPTLAQLLPFAWIVSLLLFAFVAYYQFRHVGRGYRYPPILVILLSLFLSGIFGYALNELNFTHQVEMLAKNILPIYRTCVNRQQEVWNRPEKGFLAGRIERLYPQADFDLLDPNGRQWHVIGSHAKWRHNDEGNPMQAGAQVKILGRIVGVNFEADQIVPWGKCGCTQKGYCRFEP